MKTRTLKSILSGVNPIKIIGERSIKIDSVYFDSRKAKSGGLFVAIKGTKDDGSRFIDDVIKKGVRVIVHDTPAQNIKPGVTYILVKNSGTALAMIAQNFYDNPSKKLKLVGVTGTNGKTTTATMLFKLFRSLGFKTALLSTIENKINEKSFPATHTTPDPVSLAQFLALAVEKGCTHAFMECSSHAIDQKRIGGLSFAGAIFTNLTLDHLDYHKTLKAYAKAKKTLFDNLSKNAFAIANSDDKFGKYMLRDTKARKLFFSLKKGSDFQGRILSQSLDGSELLINKKEVKTKTSGRFNAYNTLGIFATAKKLGVTQNKIMRSLKTLTPPEGRLQIIKSKKGVYGVIDYAHTPDALSNVLKTLKGILGRNHKIVTVVGCGGDRDKSKRPVMGRIACQLSDYVYFTNDNPRSEHEESILKDITYKLKGDHFEIESDRAKAISKACKKAKSGDVVLVAGKGHENYQILQDRTVHFSDLEELKKNFK